MDFEGFGFGGEFGYDKKSLKKIVSAVSDVLPQNKPRGPLADRTGRFWAWTIAGYALTVITVPLLGLTRRHSGWRARW